MNKIECPKDLNQFLVGEPYFKNVWQESECEARKFYGDCYHCFATAIAKRDKDIIGECNSVENKCFEGMTNGEVIQALFPEVKVEIDGFLVRCVFIEHEFTTTEEWWNAPYQKGGE